MSQVLGRGQHQPWVTKWPVSSLGAMLIAAVVGIGIYDADPQRPDMDSVAAVVLGPISQHEILSHRARRLQVADNGGRPRKAAHGGRCRRGTGTDARLATFSVCPLAERTAEGSDHAEGGHCAYHECANERCFRGADSAYSDDVDGRFQRDVNGHSGHVNKVGAQRRWDYNHARHLRD